MHAHTCMPLVLNRTPRAIGPMSPDTLNPNGSSIIRFAHVEPGPFRGPSTINELRCVALGGAGAFGTFPPNPPFTLIVVCVKHHLLMFSRG